MTMVSAIRVPESLNNGIEVHEDGKIAVYRGRLFNISVDGKDIRGNASLEKVVGERQQWVVYAEEREDWGHHYIIGTTGIDVLRGTYSWGVSHDRTNPACCRGALVGHAARLGILPSDELLDKVFGPLEQQCLELARKISQGQ